MKLFTSLLCACTALFLVTSASASDLKIVLEQRIPELMIEARVPCVAVAVIKKGEIEWAEVFGESGPGKKATRTTAFNVASLTKPLFAMMCLQLIARHDLELDESLDAFWVDPDIVTDPRHTTITPRLALSHRTGFQNWRGKDKLAIAFDPGTKHEYSGEGFEYLRRAIEAKTGQTMSTLLKMHVLDSAGMKDTSFGWDERWEEKIAVGYNEGGKPYSVANFKSRKPNAAANTFTTVEDYARFVVWILKGGNLPPALYLQMQQAQLTSAESPEKFGIGWMLINLGNEVVLAHSGRENGVRTQVFILPKRQQGLVVFTNSNNGELLMRSLFKEGLDCGPLLVDSIAEDAWNYLNRLSSEQLATGIKPITRSPSFAWQLLEAIHVVWIARSGLSEIEKGNARDSVRKLIFGMNDSRIDAVGLEPIVLKHILETTPSGLSFRTGLTDREIREYLADLDKLISG